MVAINDPQRTCFLDHVLLITEELKLLDATIGPANGTQGVDPYIKFAIDDQTIPYGEKGIRRATKSDFRVAPDESLVEYVVLPVAPPYDIPNPMPPSPLGFAPRRKNVDLPQHLKSLDGWH
jgi:hypothetical protein